MTCDDSWRRARAVLTARGLPTLAWVVLTHNSCLGRENPDLAVENAFGERMSYALCPAQPAVQDYCATLTREIVELGEPDGLILEACGPMGLDHSGSHDKVDFAEWSELERWLLSLCFCPACQTRYAAAGMEGRDLAGRVRAAVKGRASRCDTPDTTDTVFGELAGPVRNVRASLTSDLLTIVLGAAREAAPAIPVAAHPSAELMTPGSPDSAGGLDVEGLDTIILNGWEGVETVLRAAPPRRAGRRVAAYLRAGDAIRQTDLRTAVRALIDAGIEELHLYHLGLVGWSGLEDLKNLAAAMHEETRHP
jgi:hypothetical protein